MVLQVDGASFGSPMHLAHVSSLQLALGSRGGNNIRIVIDQASDADGDADGGDDDDDDDGGGSGPIAKGRAGRPHSQGSRRSVPTVSRKSAPQSQSRGGISRR